MLSEKLPIPRQLNGIVWHFVAADGAMRRPAHFHVELEMNFCVCGRGIYLVNSRRVELRPNAMLWLLPKDRHELVDWSGDFEMWVAVFRPLLVREVSRATEDRELLRARSREAFPRFLPRERTFYLAALLEDLHDRTGQPALHNPGLRFLLPLARQEFLAVDPSRCGETVHPAVERAVFAIARGEGDTDAETFANKCGLSRARLSRLFKQQMGTSLSAHRNHIRMQRFWEIYGDGRRITVLDAALEAGFGGAAQFYRVCRRITGRTPVRDPQLNSVLTRTRYR